VTVSWQKLQCAGKDIFMADFLKWILWGPFRSMLLVLPYGIVTRLARWFSFPAKFVLRGEHRFLTREYARIFPDKSPGEIRRMVQQTLALLCLNEFDSLLHANLSSENIENELRVTGLERLKSSLGKGQGVILLTYHFGAHYQVMPALGHRGIELAQLANSRQLAAGEDTGKKVGFWARKVFEKRRDLSGKALPVEIITVRSGVLPKSVLKRLKTGGIVVIAGDGRDTGKLVGVEFCGRDDYEFALGPVKLAMHTRAALHPVFIVRDKDNGCRSRLIIEEAVEVPVLDVEDEDAAAGECVKAACKRLEQRVLETPEYYGIEMYNYYRRRMIRDSRVRV
jgi:lauroyl/myristoyl acyltransferase